MSILYFIIALGVLIFVHEFGHFIVAKRAGIKVEKFSLGFGPKLIGFTRGETEYRISLLPLGGYVKLFGEEPEEGATRAPEADPRSFSARSARVRAAVVGAGPLMNFVLALVVMPVVFVIGKSEPAFLKQEPVVQEVVPGSVAEQHGLKPGDRIVSVGGQAVNDWEGFLNYQLLHPSTTGFLGIEPPLFGGQEAVVGDLKPGGPAEKGGLQRGDRVRAINGKTIADWSELSAVIAASEGRPQRFSVEREGAFFEMAMTPEWEASIDRYVIGIARFEERRVVKQSVGAAVVHGTGETLRLVSLTFRFLGRLMTPSAQDAETSLQVMRGGQSVMIRIPYESLPAYRMLGGPVRIARASGAAARQGLADFLYFIVFLSVQLAVLNVLPIPVLDGGHLAFIGLEGIKGRPLSTKVRAAAMQVGFVLLVGLMIFVTVGDIDALWGWQSIVDRFRQLF